MSLNEDQGFKILLGKYPDEALQLFAPEAIAAHGLPTAAVLLATEIPPLGADGTHRLMDLAVRFTFRDGGALVIVLLEHWSASARIDLPRVLRYVAELVLRHPGAPVLPVILVTDEAPPPQDPCLVHRLGTWEALRLQPRCIHLRRPEAIPPGLYANHVAIMLAALVPAVDRIGLVADVAGRYVHLPGGVDDLRTLLPFILLLARLRSKVEIAATYQRLRQDHTMLDIIDYIRAEGKAEGLISTICDLVRSGDLARDRAVSRLRHLAEQQQITTAQADVAIASLG